MPAFLRLPGIVRELRTSILGFNEAFARQVPVLYAVGDVSLLRRPSVAVVGSGEPSKDGARLAEHFAHALATAGVVVISGLSLGVDAAAHRITMARGGRTIAVIGTPLERVYPHIHAEMQHEIAARHLLVSPFPRGTEPTRNSSSLRGRVMARLADVTVVVEMSRTSGLHHQADACIALSKPLFIPEAVAANSAFTWPSKYLNRPGVSVLRHPDQVLDALRLTRHR